MCLDTLTVLSCRAWLQNADGSRFCASTIPFDPPIATGYDYHVAEGSPKIGAVIPPVLGDNQYRLHLFDGSADQIIQGGQPYVFLDEGVDHFQILDIEESLGLNPDNPKAFVTELAFAKTGLAHLTMTPLVSETAVTSVTIDIYPGTSPNLFNVKSSGLTPVAILTTASVDASAVDPSSVHFGATGTEVAPSKYSLNDMNGDSKLDLVLQFDTRKTGIKCETTLGKLTGKTKNGQSIVGSDAIQTVGCK
jgi:hypothetical protein